jgi:hypothetical protein
MTRNEQAAEEVSKVSPPTEAENNRLFAMIYAGGILVYALLFVAFLK